MSEVLSNDAVAALVDAAHRGELPDEDRPASRRSRVRKVDFTRPSRFTTDQTRRLSRVLDTFCRTAVTRLVAELRMSFEFELINITQLTWANAHAEVPPGSVSATIDAVPIGTRMLLSAELPLVLASVERLLGAGGMDLNIPERRLTEIDRTIARVFFGRVMAQLSAVFNEAAGVTFDLSALDNHVETESLAAVSEPTLSATFEVRHDRRSSTLVLLIPYVAFAPMAESFSGPNNHTEAGDDAGAAIAPLAADFEVLVQAEVGSLDLPIETILTIRPGDVIRLERPAAAGVELTVGGTAVCTGAPGRAGARRAVQVTDSGGTR